jgi:hypothetical protein
MSQYIKNWEEINQAKIVLIRDWRLAKVKNVKVEQEWLGPVSRTAQGGLILFLSNCCSNFWLKMLLDHGAGLGRYVDE